MQLETNATNIDDPVKVIRRTNSALILVLVALLTAALLQTDNKLDKALKDLNLIQTKLETLDKNWLYNYASKNAEQVISKSKEILPENIFLLLPLQRRKVAANVNLPRKKWVVGINNKLLSYSNGTASPLDVSLDLYFEQSTSNMRDVYRRGNSIVSGQTGKVSAFRTIWDFLGSPHYVYIPTSLDDKAYFKTSGTTPEDRIYTKCQIFLRKPKAKTIVKNEFNTEFIYRTDDLPEQFQGPRNQESHGGQLFAFSKFSLWEQTNNPVDNLKALLSASNEYSEIYVPVHSIQESLFPLREFIKVTGISKIEAPFSSQFPELNAYIDKYPDLLFSSLALVLQDLKASGQDYFQMFGLRIPSIYLTYFGFGAIMVLSLELLLHLGDIRHVISCGRWTCDIGWVGIYRGFMSKVTTIASVVVLPWAMCIYLLLISITESTWKISNSVLAVLLVVQSVMAIYLLVQIIKIWKTLNYRYVLNRNKDLIKPEKKQ